jgi:probable HAF family extracellular repeat protein
MTTQILKRFESTHLIALMVLTGALICPRPATAQGSSHEVQLQGQSPVPTAAAAAKAALGREVRAQAASPGPTPAGTFYEVRFPGAIGTCLEGINPHGDIVGVYQDDSSNYHNFLLSNGTFSNIGPPGGQGPAFLFLPTQMGINPQGDIVGNYVDSNGATRAEGDRNSEKASGRQGLRA